MAINFEDLWGLLVESNVLRPQFLQLAAVLEVSTHVLGHSAQEYANTDIKLELMVVPPANVTILVQVIPVLTEKSASESEMQTALVSCALDILSVSMPFLLTHTDLIFSYKLNKSKPLLIVQVDLEYHTKIPAMSVFQRRMI